uniref:Integrase catalytic domain-containing protein n=1 Tax=Tanacetum cinerariifolium TaxID=118510 RepID=A0A699GUE4_TANCI|nr:hypothetical protein [Tanacetum cinerariifolium]
MASLLKKSAFQWLEHATLAFKELEQAMMQSSVLALPKFEEEFIIKTNASSYGVEPGKENVVDDALFRVQQQGQLCQMLISIDTNKLIRAVKTTWSTDSKLKVVIECLQQGSFHDSKCTWSANELKGKGKLVVANDEAVRLKLITYFHRCVVGVHSGVQETLKRIYAFYYCKGLGKMVKHQIYLCDVCQRNKLYLVSYPGLLQPLPILEKVWKDVSMYFIKALQVSQGRTMIMVVMDRLSKYAHFIPLSNPFTTAQLAQAFLDNIYKLHSPPFTIVSDRDKLFGYDPYWCRCYPPMPVTSVIFPASTVVMRLAQHGEAIPGIQEHLLEVPIQEELRALRDRVEVAEAEMATLCATIRSMGAVETSLRNRMRDKR